MRRNDEQFKAEIFRRFDAYKIKRKKRLMAAGGTALMLILFVGVLWMPIQTYLSPITDESTSVSTTMAYLTDEEAMTTVTEEAFPYGTQYNEVLDGDALTDLTTATTVGLPESITVKRGLKTWKLIEEDDMAAFFRYICREDDPAVRTETAGKASVKKYVLVFVYETETREELFWEKADFEDFLEELLEKE